MCIGKNTLIYTTKMLLHGLIKNVVLYFLCSIMCNSNDIATLTIDFSSLHKF
jgi:hypothetical protein